MVARHDHVIAATAGQQLPFQGLVGVEHIVDRLDTRAFLEVRQGVGGDVIGPVVDIDDILGPSQAWQGQGAEQGGQACFFCCWHHLVLRL
ncbi:hypothetical protein D3C86_1861160 [compost metagenome]